MTIDEAIAHAREVASEQKRRSGTCVQNDDECDKFSNCIKCAEEHEQLAEWLEELKEFRNNDSYKKALDDFVRQCDKQCGFYNGKTHNLTRDEVLMIVHQLKNKNYYEKGCFLCIEASSDCPVRDDCPNMHCKKSKEGDKHGH